MSDLWTRVNNLFKAKFRQYLNLNVRKLTMIVKDAGKIVQTDGKFSGQVYH